MLKSRSESAAKQFKVLRKITSDAASNFLSELVQIPSVTGSEGDVARFIHEWCQKNGLSSELQRVKGDRYNVLVKLRGSTDKSTIHFDGHIDTYPMTDEWDQKLVGKITKDRVYGIGSVDDKGGTAAMLIAAKAVTDSSIEIEGNVLLTAVPGHLEGGSGVRSLIEKGFKADAGVVCEPTTMKIITCHMASLYFEIVTRGVPALDTYKENGINAILHMVRIIEELQSLEKKYQKKYRHPVLGVPLVNIGKVNGGFRHNIVPDVCTLDFSIRYLPGQTTEGIKKEIQAMFEALKRKEIPNLDANISYLKGWYDWPRLPLEISPKSALVRSVIDAYGRVIGEKPTVAGEKYWTDASIFTGAGIPSIVFGPGNDECYWVDEFMERDQLVNAAKTYASLMLDMSAKTPAAIRAGLN
ncbi:MAG: M20/M25/M40 family metallo-hydrolase [Thaumarchaeota archaeon]|nr:M20/M25/M40 family metallo-hydrolase [Nitrososphaerota archaeon]